MSRRAFPASLYVRDRRCVVLGDGEGASRRAARLAEAGARVARVGEAAYQAGACAGAFAVIVHTETAALDLDQVAADARGAGALVYVHDRPDLSDFAMPAVAEHGRLHIAISTEGVAPALARRLREQLERALRDAGPALDALIEELERVRGELPPERRAAELYRIASRLALHGRLEVADGPAPGGRR